MSSFRLKACLGAVVIAVGGLAPVSPSAHAAGACEQAEPRRCARYCRTSIGNPARVPVRYRRTDSACGGRASITLSGRLGGSFSLVTRDAECRDRSPDPCDSVRSDRKPFRVIRSGGSVKFCFVRNAGFRESRFITIKRTVRSNWPDRGGGLECYKFQP